MAWVVLLGLGVIVFLVFFFRAMAGARYLRWLLLYVLGLAAFGAAGFLNTVLIEQQSYRDAVVAVSRIGRWILISAATVLAADLVAMVVYTIAHGRPDHRKGKVITTNRWVSTGPLDASGLHMMDVSRRKILGGRRKFVTDESLVDGTATLGERMMVLGIITCFVSFGAIWIGIGLLLMKDFWLAVLIPVLPGLFVYHNLREAWRDHQKAKAQFAEKHRGARPAADWESGPRSQEMRQA